MRPPGHKGWGPPKRPPKDWRDITVWGYPIEGEGVEAVKLAYGIYTRELGVHWCDYMLSGGRFRKTEVRDPNGKIMYTKEAPPVPVQEEANEEPDNENDENQEDAMNDSDRCDQEVFDKGVSLLAIDGWAKDVEPWVQKVAKLSEQQVDWHYSGGVAHVLVLGDFDKAMSAADALESELIWNDSDEERFKNSERRNPRILRRFTNQGDGLYRAGEPSPEDTIGVDSTGLL